MECQEGNVQRVFAVRFSPGERVIEGLEALVREKGIGTGIVIFLGALSEADLVLGFRKHSRMPMDFDRTSFTGTREVIGVGSISWTDGKPKVHLHAGVAREREVLIAHIVEGGIAGMEAFVLELTGEGFRSSALV